MIVVKEPELFSAVKEPVLLVVVGGVVVLLPVVYFLFLPESHCILVHVVLFFPGFAIVLLPVQTFRLVFMWLNGET